MNTDIDSIYNKLKKARAQKKSLTGCLKKSGYNSKKAFDIVKIFKISKTLKRFKAGLDVTTVENPEEWKSELKFTESYVYNKESDKYVVYLKAANGNVVLPGELVRGMIENYSNWYGNSRTINEICRNYRIPRNYFEELKNVFQITHDSEPVTREELLEKDISALSEDIVQKKKFQLYQKVQKKSWKDTEESAKKWHELIEGTYNPFNTILKNWKPPQYTPSKAPVSKNRKTEKAILIGLSDVHFGAYANATDSFRGVGASTDNTVNNIEDYATNIAKFVNERNYEFKECVIAGLGDILHTTGRGVTTKGTPLVFDCLKEEQFDAALSSLTKFIQSILELFPRVRVKSVKGNHNDFGDYVLFKALEAYFKPEKRIDFEIYRTEQGLFKINNTLFIISHGYNAEYPGHLPRAGKARESYIANLFLTYPEKLIGVKTKVLLTADQHHTEAKEYAEFEHYMLSTLVPNDGYSEAMGLKSVAKQSCFVIDDFGVSEILHSYVRNTPRR
jgi:hypothetical protein